MIKVKDGYAKLVGTTYTGNTNNLLKSDGGIWEVNAEVNNSANKIVRTDSSGYLKTGWINTISGNLGTTAITRIYCSNDLFIRYKTPANFFEALANDGDNISVTIASLNRKLVVGYATKASLLRSAGTLAPQTGRTQTLGDVYSYQLNASVSGGPTTYASVIGFGRGTAGTVEIAGKWTSGGGLWTRALRDTTDNWYDWDQILTAKTYSSIINTDFYTKTESDNRFVNVTGDTMTGLLKNSNSDPIRLCSGDYGVIFKKDSNNFYILLTNSGEAVNGNFNSLRPFYINLSTGRVSMNCGLTVNSSTIVCSSTILGNTVQGNLLVSTVATGKAPLVVSSTTLVGNLNSDLVDSWHGVGTEGSVLRKSGYVYSSTSGLASYWGKVGYFTFKSKYNDRDITLYMHSAYNLYRAIVHIRGRWNDVNNVNVELNILSGNIPKDRIRLYYDASSASGLLELWYNCVNIHSGINVYVISDTDRMGGEGGNITLIRENFKEVQTPTLTTYIEATYVSLLNNVSTATKLATARTINGTSFDGSANITTTYWGTARNITIGNTTKSVNGSGNYSWTLKEIGVDGAYLPLIGGTMTGTINSTLSTSTYLLGNLGRVLINSTCSAGNYTMLFKGNSTNGYFTHGVYTSKYILNYTAKTTVDAESNKVDKSATLLDESGNTYFPGLVLGYLLKSTVASTKGAPLVVASKDLVTNLNSLYLNGFLSSDFLRVSLIAKSTDVNTLLDTLLYYTDTDANSATLTNSAFTTSHAMLQVKCYADSNTNDYRRPRLAFSASGELKIFNDRVTSGTGGTWINVLTASNYNTLIDASKYFTALSSTAATNVSITIGGTTKTVANLYARYLCNNYTSRQASMNVMFGDGTLRHFLATSTTTTGKPMKDGHIIHLAWDNTGNWDSLLYVTNLSSASMLYRYQGGSTTWGNWITLVDSSNYTSLVTKIGTASKGNANKPIYLNAGVPTECNNYAGGTALTLNGTSKASSTASIYAPTAAGTSGQVLTSTGGAPSWTNQSSLSTNWNLSTTWAASLTLNKWSRILTIKNYSNIFVSINFTQNSLASLHLYLISTGYSNARVILLGANGYTSNYNIQVRLTLGSSATEHHLEVYATYGYNEATTLSVNCRATIIGTGSTITPITTYTEGSGTVKSSLTSSNTLCTNLNADMLDGVHANGLFTGLANSGNNLSITIGGTNKTLAVAFASKALYLIVNDTRDVNNTPSTFNAGARFELKKNATDGLNDTGTYHGILHLRAYGSDQDFSGGKAHLLAFTDNGNLYMRTSTSATAWGSWKCFMDTASADAKYVTLTTAQNISGVKTFLSLLRFSVAKGTSPFTVASDTVVLNLNADLLDGKHASDFVTLTNTKFSLYNLGTYTKILEFTIPTNNLSVSISFTWHPSEYARNIWADFNINIRSGAVFFYANWKGGITRELWCVGDGTTYLVWVIGTKTTWDPYGVIQITDTFNINSYKTGNLAYLDTEPTGTYVLKATTTGLAAKINARVIWGQAFDGTKDISGDMTGVGNLNASGNIYAAHFYENSDIRYKTVVNNLSVKVSQIANLPLFDFTWKDCENLLHTGTSAQSVQEILPYIVSGEDKLTLDYGVLGTITGVIACRELTEQEKEIEMLKKRVKELEDKINIF